MRTSFVRYVSPTPRHTSFRKERAIVGAARGRSSSAIPDLELIHPGVSDLNRETPFANSTRILSVVVAHLHCADGREGHTVWAASVTRRLAAGDKRERARRLGRACVRSVACLLLRRSPRPWLVETPVSPAWNGATSERPVSVVGGPPDARGVGRVGRRATAAFVYQSGPGGSYALLRSAVTPWTAARRWAGRYPRECASIVTTTHRRARCLSAISTG